MSSVVSRARKRGAFPFVVSIIVAWLLFIGYLIWRQPLPGAASPEQLRSTVLSTVTTGDDDRLSSLFLRNTVGDEYAESFLAKLKGAEAASWESTITTVDGQAQLVLTSSGPGAALCSAWPLVQDGERWKLDGVPAVVNACAPGS